jgi:hypothetical protein
MIWATKKLSNITIGHFTGSVPWVTVHPNTYGWTEHMAQRSDSNRQSCPKASTRTYFGLRFGPEMRRPRQPARPLARPFLSAPGPADRGFKPFPFPSPMLPCCARSSFFPSSAPPRPPPVFACRPDGQKRSPSFHRTLTPP